MAPKSSLSKTRFRHFLKAFSRTRKGFEKLNDYINDKVCGRKYATKCYNISEQFCFELAFTIEDTVDVENI